ncbi:MULTISPECIES: hypothetical protein [unclassified Beijerinckia]|uniref:hypothetical protein n=1 Tax=unclassified Beijerinckia TaxID=2638183 RepID=UPI000894A35D|nr:MULTISPECIES: hypothetical protein [unclassified Beijerinckia]MDH7796394.1 hypothetical protein [Beijerinckia sp. GAS462]SEC43287.1 hypothetical protein SAMN05443249_2677 [Beijerinckia sp. 28-YEA-48]
MARRPKPTQVVQTEERYCVIAPLVHTSHRKWKATEDEAIKHAETLLSHTDRPAAELVVVKAIAFVRPAPKPIQVSRDVAEQLILI